MAASATARRATEPARTPRRPAARPAPARRRAHVRGPSVRERAAALPRRQRAAVFDALLYGRGWIAIVFVLLAGIVFFNVDLLRMNRGIATATEQSNTIKRENARLRGEIARLGSSERIQRVAAEAGLVLPAPGEVRYRTASPDADARKALQRLDEDAAAVEDASVVPLPQASVPEAPQAPAPVASEPGSQAAAPVASEPASQVPTPTDTPLPQPAAPVVPQAPVPVASEPAPGGG